jgi:hypothetical protein
MKPGDILRSIDFDGISLSHWRFTVFRKTPMFLFKYWEPLKTSVLKGILTPWRKIALS